MAICGSSVAFGWRSPKDEGWSTLLANALKERYGHQLLGPIDHSFFPNFFVGGKGGLVNPFFFALKFCCKIFFR